MESPMPRTVASWICRIVAAVVLFQTLMFKFTAAPESVYIFGKLGLEPWGRIASGLAELVAGVLLLVPQTAVLGALLSLAIISGAIVSHLTVLGIAVQGDGGLLFFLAITVFVASGIVLLLERQALGRLSGLALELSRRAGRSSKLPVNRATTR
jgi:hypothetical protein